MCSFELVQSTSTMSPFKVIRSFKVPSTSSDAASYIVGFRPKRSADLNTATLEVKASSVAIDDTYSTWNPMNSVGRKCRQI